MASSTGGVEVVTTQNRCEEIVKDLLQNHSIVAVDAEGVNLGKTGPLTLLQVGTKDEKIYLFDIETDKSQLGEGCLKDLLESEAVMKIIHSCKGDSAALRFQFDVTLKNVFDTQIAHLAIEESNGRRLPAKAKLADMCDKYGGLTAALASKDDVKKAWTVTAGYWARRPLTPEMIEYAAVDVLVLFSIYENQLQILTEKQLQEKFRAMVAEETVALIDDAVEAKRNSHFRENVEIISLEIDIKCRKGECHDLSTLNEDETTALLACRSNKIPLFSPAFQTVRKERYQLYMLEVKEKINADPKSFEVPVNLYGKLLSNERLYRGTALADMSKELRQLLQTVERDIIERKFTAETPLEYMKPAERNFFRRVMVDKEKNPTLVTLFNRVMYQDLLDLQVKYQNNPREFSMSENLYRQILYLANSSRRSSPELKKLSGDIWRSFVQQYGKYNGF